MNKYKYYSRNYQDKKINQNTKTNIPKPQGKNLKNKNTKKPVIQTNDTFIIEYNEEEGLKQYIPPKNPTKYNRRGSADSFRTKKNISNISSILGKAKLKKEKIPNKMTGSNDDRKNRNGNNENKKKEKKKLEKMKAKEPKREEIKIEEMKLDKIKADLKSEIKSEIVNSIKFIINTSENNIINTFKNSLKTTENNIIETLRNGFKFLGSVFNKNYEEFEAAQKKKMKVIIRVKEI